MRSHTDFESRSAAEAVRAADFSAAAGGGGWSWLIGLFAKLSYPAKFGLVGFTMVLAMGYLTCNCSASPGFDTL